MYVSMILLGILVCCCVAYIAVLRQRLNKVQEQVKEARYSAQIAADKQAKTRRERLRETISAMPDGIVVIDGNGLIQMVNPDASYTFSYIPNELIGKDIRSILPGFGKSEQEPVYEGKLTEAFQRGKGGARRELQGVKKSGRLVSVDVMVSDVQLEDAVGWHVCIVRDISERKKIEQMRKEMMSLVSHHLRDPLAAIFGSLKLIKSENLYRRDRQMIDIASRNTQRLVDLLNTLLEMEMLDANVLPIPVGALELSPLLESAVETKRKEAEARRLELIVQNECPEKFVVANAVRVQQVLEQLLHNAIEASPPNSAVEIYVTHQIDRVEIGVRDHGPVIPEDMRERVFARFVQGEDLMLLRARRGLGLGMAKAICEKIGGSISLETQDGAGTTFKMTLLEADVAMMKMLSPVSVNQTSPSV